MKEKETLEAIRLLVNVAKAYREFNNCRFIANLTDEASQSGDPVKLNTSIEIARADRDFLERLINLENKLIAYYESRQDIS